jgi:hypothetical protein
MTTYLHKGGPIAKDLKPVRNVKPLWSKYGLLGGVVWVGRHVDGQPHRLEPVRHDAPRQIGCRGHGQGEELQADRLSQARWRAELRPPDQCQLLDDQPRGKPARAPDAQGRGVPIGSTCPNMPSPRSGIARPASTRWSRRTARTRASSSTSRTASTARPAISRTLRRTSTGPCRRAATGRTIPTCDADSRGAAGIPARIRVAHETVTANLAA